MARGAAVKCLPVVALVVMVLATLVDAFLATVPPCNVDECCFPGPPREDNPSLLRIRKACKLTLPSDPNGSSIFSLCTVSGAVMGPCPDALPDPSMDNAFAYGATLPPCFTDCHNDDGLVVRRRRCSLFGTPTTCDLWSVLFPATPVTPAARDAVLASVGLAVPAGSGVPA
eukprot:TRINITY_DN5494_c0_g1_i2.p2 TRINITY_DN5494_c0_g1~~TRINITY_DN5494_c0_g1_i2.p2  ORF type:complete len:171 (-),score=51.62 TRINITY_DN5494_c0_g1_i2:234-746(-)